MSTIEVDQDTKRAVAFAAEMAGVTEGEIVRRLVATRMGARQDESGARSIPIFADYLGHRTRAFYFPPARVEIIDGPLKGMSYRTPTGAARAVVRLHKPGGNDNRNGWGFWQLENAAPRTWLQSIRPTGADN